MTRQACVAIVVFAKAPQAGEVKTRLVPHLTPQQAADFYSAMLTDVLATTAEFARSLKMSATVAVEPWVQRSSVVSLAPTGLRVVPQRGPDLAARMTWAVLEAAAAGAERILLRGSDSPTLDGETLAQALAALEDQDLALRPDLDGGYGLVGLRRPASGLFDHAMSTSRVLEETLTNAERLGLRTHLMEPGFDIDTPADLARLAAGRTLSLSALCPRTLGYLDRNDLWPRP